LGCAVLIGIPGWAASRALELHLRVPTVLFPATYFTLGLGVFTIVLVPTLALRQPIDVIVTVHLIVTAALVLFTRMGERRRGHAKLGSDAFSGWTLVAIALSVVAALVLRTRMAFDTLFHLGLVRRMLELDAPGFADLDRVVGAGVNPAYALPSWQAAMAGISAITGLDPAAVVESMSIVAVLVAACAAAGLGRVVTGSLAGELAGAGMYAWLRVLFTRRELEGDGVAYAALPGNIAIDVMLAMALIAGVLMLQRRGGARGNHALMLLGMAAVAQLVVLHANYVVYLAIIGLGVALWLLVAGPWNRDVARRLGAVGALIAVPAAIVLAALLPVLMLLEHFGAGVVDARIDYHLVTVAGFELVRPGHLYDWFSVAGLVGMLLLPWGAWRARGAARALIAGGSIMLLAFALLPPLLALLGASGSLTLGLRLPRPLGLLMIAAAAVALPDLVARVSRLATAACKQRGKLAGWLVRLAPLAAIAALAAMYGYPLTRREPPEFGWNWPTLVAAVALLVVLVVAIRRRASAQPLDTRAPGFDSLSTRRLALSLVAIGICLLPSGLTSLRRAAWQATDLAPAWRADDLACFAGVRGELRKLRGGAALLADPVTGYGAQAVGPVRIAADFKTWNGSTDADRITRRIDQLHEAFDSSSSATAGAALARMADELDARYVLVARGEVVPPIGSELTPHDAVGLRALLNSGDLGATKLAAGPGTLPKDAPDEKRAACDLELWELDGSEARFDTQRPEVQATSRDA
ncbi:MAG: hypothetical protein ABI200_00040, partial [Gaiellales bacterium]